MSPDPDPATPPWASEPDPLRDATLPPAGDDEPAAPRTFLAAARVVMRDAYAEVPHRPDAPGSPEDLLEHVDWPATFALRRRLDAAGFGIAEAMDTAQRFEVGWPVAERLIEGTGALGLRHGFVAGAGADHVDGVRDAEALARAVGWQCERVRAAGGVPIVLPMPELVRWGTDAEGYVRAYRAVLEHSEGPLLVHWLGPMFHPGLVGYFPGDSLERVLALDRERFVGVKLSLLDAALERRLRRALAPHGQVVFTGDDHHFADLVLGERDAVPTGTRPFLGRDLPVGDFSHALLGVFDGVHRPAGLALRRLARGEPERARELLRACEPFGRHVFGAPVSAYKAGLAFRAWLDGEQSNAMLPNHAERLRDPAHLREVARLAAACGALADRVGAAARLATAFAAPERG